MEEQYFPS